MLITGLLNASDVISIDNPHASRALEFFSLFIPFIWASMLVSSAHLLSRTECGGYDWEIIPKVDDLKFDIRNPPYAYPDVGIDSVDMVLDSLKQLGSFIGIYEYSHDYRISQFYQKRGSIIGDYYVDLIKSSWSSMRYFMFMTYRWINQFYPIDNLDDENRIEFSDNYSRSLTKYSRWLYFTWKYFKGMLLLNFAPYLFYILVGGSIITGFISLVFTSLQFKLSYMVVTIVIAIIMGLFIAIIQFFYNVRLSFYSCFDGIRNYKYGFKHVFRHFWLYYMITFIGYIVFMSGISGLNKKEGWLAPVIIYIIFFIVQCFLIIKSQNLSQFKFINGENHKGWRIFLGDCI